MQTSSTGTTPSPAPATPAAPAASTAAAASSTPAQTRTFTERLDAEMKRIASHASKVETLKNGARLYFLANGREVEQVPGKTPYVVRAGTPPAKPAPASTPAAATTAPATTTSAAPTQSGPAKPATTGK